MIKNIFYACGVVVLLQPLKAATLVFTGGSLISAGSWDNLTDGGTKLPGNGDAGTINTDGVIGGTSVNWGTATVTQTGGVITTSAANNNFNFPGGGTFNLEGGALSTRGLFANGANSVINLTGGTLQLGSTTSTSIAFGSRNNGTLTIGGTIEINAAQAYNVVVDGDGILEISGSWTGSWTNPGFSGVSDWSDTLSSLNVVVDGTSVTSSNFDSLFAQSSDNQTISLVPEPSVVSLTSLIGLLLLSQRRRID